MKLYFFGAIEPRVHQLQGATSDTERSSRAVAPKELFTTAASTVCSKFRATADTVLSSRVVAPEKLLL